MRMHTHLWKSVLGKAALATVALGGFLFFGGAPSAQANDRDRDDYRHEERYENLRRHEAYEHRYWQHERREAFEHGWWRDRYGCLHRY
jgi:hypothetical protein